MERLYKQNKDFRDYVDKYCRKHDKTVDEVIKHELVREYGKMCREKETVI